MFNKLFDPMQLGARTFENRLVIPAVHTMGHGSVDGFVTDSVVAHYDRLAAARPGLIIVESTAVMPKPKGGSEQRGLYLDAHIEGQARIAAAIHAHGVPCIVQLQTSGLTGKGAIDPPTIADYEGDDFDTYYKGHGMTVDELHNVQERFISAAVRAQKAGYDGVEIHGAHRYLIAQTLSPIVNTRTDEYGGSVENRARFAVEIARGIRAQCGPDFLLAIRLGMTDISAEELAQTIELLRRAGVELFDLSHGLMMTNAPRASYHKPAEYPFSDLVYGASRIRKLTDAPLICVGEITNGETAERILEADIADFTAVARYILVDAAWPDRVRTGQEIFPCFHCKPRCRFLIDGQNCPGRAAKAKKENK
ncbi:MAG: NADH:flavin oxidoreductase [Clostridia bacterium]|nr:NADH:flavin oxidoreductase [Clostridia bacterium]